MQPLDRRKELGRFLRTKRETMVPEEVGLLPTSHRRTPGLRREEVAQLAQISSSVYTRLEQGRDIGVSAEVYEHIAQVLRLSHCERVHLFSLASKLPTLMPPMHEQVTPALKRVMDNWAPNVAYVLGRRWDIIGANKTARAVFPKMPPADNPDIKSLEWNLVCMMFTLPSARQAIVAWEQHAQRIVKNFRVDYAQYSGDPYFEMLVEYLLDASTEFARWWECPNIDVKIATRKEIIHPLVGRLIFEQTAYRDVDVPGLKLILDSPLDEETAQKLRYLYTIDEEHSVGAS